VTCQHACRATVLLPTEREPRSALGGSFRMMFTVCSKRLLSHFLVDSNYM
jgi:hypothetical protein